jgi:predicted metallo-beta-lactamase superfamily hydrolase
MLRFIVEFHLIRDEDYEAMEKELSARYPTRSEMIGVTVRGLVQYLDA